MIQINIQQVMDLLMTICLNHRVRFRINRPTRVNDCDHLKCKTSCPIMRMPQVDWWNTEKIEEVKK